MWKQLLTLVQLREKSSQVESSSLLLVVYSQLYLEAPWHRLRAGNVRPAGSTSSHSGWWWVNTLTHYLFSLLFDTWCIFTVFDVTAEKSLPTRFFTPASSLCPVRGHGFQLFHWTHEENESKLSTRRSYGHSLCKHALTNPGHTASTNPHFFFTFFSHNCCLNFIYNYLIYFDRLSV